MEVHFGEVDATGFETLRLLGECDLYNAQHLTKAALERLARGVVRLRIDMSGVSYLDSTGIGAIIRLVQASKKMGRELRFSGISGTPRRVLTMSNIISIMKEDVAPGTVK
ncbi:MAG TPA: STAS domain-containing protein [Rectinemataceae bacterium]|nr:STAS domain-containing protein [Rectinemataceae bacterium]